MSIIPDGHFISVIVPTIGREGLEKTREALARQSRPADEIIIKMDEDHRGPAFTRNRALEESRGDLIAFTDDDCIPPEEWLETLMRAIDRYGAAGAGGTYDEQDPLLRDIRARRNFPSQEGVDTFGWVVTTGNVMYRREWLTKRQQMDGFVFDETVLSTEDADLALRIRQLGGTLVFVPLRVSHERYVDGLGFLRLQFFRGRGIADLYQIQNRNSSSITHQASLLWGNGTSRRRPRWVTVLFRKVLGPFDRKSFSSWRHFALFWIGEKCEGAGFVWENLSGRLGRARAGRARKQAEDASSLILPGS